MKAGEEYERFVYDKVRRLFPHAEVRHDDHLVGRRSKRSRQVDVSIRMAVDNIELLYIVSCKDRLKRPADLPILGEFASVIDDVGANKGFLLCTSGFARTNHDYARSLGIELWTITDMQSARWHVEVDIPIVYVQERRRLRTSPHHRSEPGVRGPQP